MKERKNEKIIERLPEEWKRTMKRTNRSKQKENKENRSRSQRK